MSGQACSCMPRTYRLEPTPAPTTLEGRVRGCKERKAHFLPCLRKEGYFSPASMSASRASRYAVLRYMYTWSGISGSSTQVYYTPTPRPPGIRRVEPLHSYPVVVARSRFGHMKCAMYRSPVGLYEDHYTSRASTASTVQHWLQFPSAQHADLPHSSSSFILKTEPRFRFRSCARPIQAAKPPTP